MPEVGYNYFRDRDEAPVFAWTGKMPIEESAKEQIHETAKLPFIFDHMAVMPDVHAGKGSTIGTVIPTDGAVVPAAVGVDIGCFHPDTKIPLLDGTQRTMKELTDFGSAFWVYSIDPKTQRVAPGKAHAFKTRSNAELVKVTVSGGDEVICTPDHEFMRVDGSYCRADELHFNDSLMPLYRRWDTRDGYERASNGKGTSRPTHLLVYEYLSGPVPKGCIVHHDNHNHFDNSPPNLCALLAGEHSSLHRMMRHSFQNADPNFQKARHAGMAAKNSEPARQAQMAEIGTRNIKAYMEGRPDHFQAAVAGNGKRGASHLRKFNITPRPCPECHYRAKNPADLRWHKVRAHSEEAVGCNHKVVSVEKLPERSDVYCLQVEDHNNFALAAGVFVHNCGMVAVKIDCSVEELKRCLFDIRIAIEMAVPHGRSDNGGPNDKGAWKELPALAKDRWIREMSLGVSDLLERHPRMQRRGSLIERAERQLGTLGTGNHFIEVCADEERSVWIMLHSGSRGIGNAIGNYFTRLAQELNKRWFITLPNPELAYLVKGEPSFDDYMRAVLWAQWYAEINRMLMLHQTIQAISETLKRTVKELSPRIECRHNYVRWENHKGRNVLVTRKGAVSARSGELGIIPSSMGQPSFIVAGKGNPDSFFSCSHGTGRKMSRREARRKFDKMDIALQTAGLECRKDSIEDELPGCYKDPFEVMHAQADLVDIMHTLRAMVCVKG